MVEVFEVKPGGLRVALEQVKKLEGKPYRLELECGQDYSGEGTFTLESNGTITSRGDGPRPIIKRIHTVHGVRDVFSNVTIENLQVLDGIALIGGNTNVRIYNNVFDHCELTVQHFDGNRPGKIEVVRNIFTGAFVNTSSYHNKSRPSNIYAAGIDGLLIEENVLDYGGWHPTEPGAGANMFNHNAYLQAGSRGVVVRNNIIVRGSSHGIQMRSGGLAEDNFFARNAIGLLMGYDKEPVLPENDCIARRNVVSEAHSMVKGHDCGKGPNLITGALWGIDFVVNGGKEWCAEDNLVSGHCHEDVQTVKSTVTRAYQGIGQGVICHRNKQASLGNPVEGVEQLDKPAPTLADYADHLGIPGGFNGFMNKVLSRGINEWDERLTAKAINAFIRGETKPEVVETEDYAVVGGKKYRLIPV